MKPGQYAVERRVALLAQMIPKRIHVMRQAIAPEGKRPPFSEQLSEKDALDWWRVHRFDNLGQQVTANMDPQSLLELDGALSRQIEAETMEVQVDGIP